MKKFLCVICKETFPKKSLGGNAETTPNVCFSCFDNAVDEGGIVFCSICGKPNWQQSVYMSNDGTNVVCTPCFTTGGFIQCRDCGDILLPTESTADDFCARCRENRLVRVQERPFDPDDKSFISTKTTGYIIKSLRPFGLEIELIHKKMAEIAKLSNDIEQSFGFEHDGSIRDERGNRLRNGVEIISPVLAGKKGEDAVLKLLEEVNKRGFEVNQTCGVHVHLSAPEYRRNGFTKKLQVSDLRGQALQLGENKPTLHVFERGLLDNIGEALNIKTSKVFDFFMSQTINPCKRFSSNMDIMGLGYIDIKKTLEKYGRKRKKYEKIFFQILRVKDKEKRELRAGFYFTVNPEILKRIDTALESDKNELLGVATSLINHSFRDRKLHPHDTLFVTMPNNAFQNTRTLLYLYAVYTDVFLSMLPRSRRENNRYCQKLYNKMSLADIRETKNYEELEALWYKTNDFVSRERRKGGTKYDPSRYYGVNLHSLFSKNGTIEVRWHAGTTDPKNILYWVALHQHIVDTIASNKLSIVELSQGEDLFKVGDKIEMLLKLLKLRPSLEKYVRARIDYFSEQ